MATGLTDREKAAYVAGMAVNDQRTADWYAEDWGLTEDLEREVTDEIIEATEELTRRRARANG